jgi:hypothetical protein
VQRLYDLGARRVLVQGVDPIGCVPAELALHSLDGSCDRELQRAAEMYNPRLMAPLSDREVAAADGRVSHTDGAEGVEAMASGPAWGDLLFPFHARPPSPSRLQG